MRINPINILKVLNKNKTNIKQNTNLTSELTNEESLTNLLEAIKTNKYTGINNQQNTYNVNQFLYNQQIGELVKQHLKENNPETTKQLIELLKNNSIRINDSDSSLKEIVYQQALHNSKDDNTSFNEYLTKKVDPTFAINEYAQTLKTKELNNKKVEYTEDTAKTKNSLLFVFIFIVIVLIIFFLK